MLQKRAQFLTCGMMDIFDRRKSSGTVRMSIPSMRIAPPQDSLYTIRNRLDTRLDLPAPVRPRTPTCQWRETWESLKSKTVTPELCGECPTYS